MVLPDLYGLVLVSTYIFLRTPYGLGQARIAVTAMAALPSLCSLCFSQWATGPGNL